MTSATQPSFDAAQQSQATLRRAFDAGIESMEQMMPVPLGLLDLTPFVDWYFDAAEQMLRMQRQFLKSLASSATAVRKQPRGS